MAENSGRSSETKFRSAVIRGRSISHNDLLSHLFIMCLCGGLVSGHDFSHAGKRKASVVLLFLGQIARGGPVTVTDPDVERYFLNMEEAVQRVLACAASGLGDGAIATPVTGIPIRIVDLARYLIEQASAKDLEITYTGLRPGDKLQEQFVFEREAVRGSRVDGVQWVDRPGVPEGEFAAGLAELNTSLDDANRSQHLTVLTRLVPECQASSSLLQQAGIPVAH
jgi:FlaA1/EpsC-like NDP-sugar epimerase